MGTTRPINLCRFVLKRTCGTHFSRLSCDPEAAKTNMGTTRPPLPRPVKTKGTHTCKRLLAVMVVGGIVEGGCRP